MYNYPLRHTLDIKDCKYYFSKEVRAFLKQSSLFFGAIKTYGRKENKIYIQPFYIYNANII